jgi:hypothetical protein
MATTSTKEDPVQSGMDTQDHMEDSDVEELGQANEKVEHTNKDKKAPVRGNYKRTLFIQTRN